MSVVLPVEIQTLRAERVAAELLVAPFFADDRPLRGAAGRVDWRLCGLVSERLAEGQAAGGAGWAMLIPSQGRLASPRVLLLGLGDRSVFAAPVLARLARDAAGRAAALRAGRVALALPAQAASGLDPARAAPAAAQGVADFLSEHAFALRLTLLMAPEEAAAAAGSLAELAREPLAPGVRLRLETAQAADPQAVVPGGTRTSRPLRPPKLPTLP